MVAVKVVHLVASMAASKVVSKVALGSNHVIVMRSVQERRKTEERV